MLFHVLDPQEIQPSLSEPVLLVDMETQDSIEVSPEYARTEYREKMDAHIAESAGQDARARAWITCCSIPAGRSTKACASTW